MNLQVRCEANIPWTSEWRREISAPMNASVSLQASQMRRAHMEKALMLFIVLNSGTANHMVDAIQPSSSQTAASDTGVPVTVDGDRRQKDGAANKLSHTEVQGTGISIVSR
jgi:hypothetical protein